MNIRHFRAIVRKEFYQILRDPGTLILLTLGPVFLLLVFVFMLTTEVKDVPTAIVDLSQNDASAHLIEALNGTKEILITQHLDSVEQANTLFDRGEIRALVVIPARYGDALALVTGSIPQFKIVIDGTEPLSAERVLEKAYTLVEEDLRRIVQESPIGQVDAVSALLDSPVKIDVERRYNPELRYLIGYYPGIAAMVLSLPGVALTLAITREKELGTLENLVATPISKLGLLMGKITPYMFFGVVDAILIVAVGQIFFDVPFHGSIFGYAFLSFFFMISNMGLGLVISILVQSQQLAMVLAFLIFFIPGFFLSGIFFPMWAMPAVVRIDLLALPVTHYVAVSQAMYLQGASILDLWLNTIALIILSVAMLALSVVVFRKKVAL